MIYPKILLPQKSYPILDNSDLQNNALVRETKIDIYQYLSSMDCEPEDVLPLIIAPQPSLREVFELSIFLYGYYNEQHIGIRVDNTDFYSDWNNDLPELQPEEIKFTQKKVYPLFFTTSKLNNQEIDFNGDIYTLSFSHKPTRVNYWHFELWVKNNIGDHIPRDKSNAHIKYLAKSILEYIISEAIISKESVISFKRTEFEDNLK